MKVMAKRLTVLSAALILAGPATAAQLSELHTRNIAEINKHHPPTMAASKARQSAAQRHAAIVDLDSESSLQVLTHESSNAGEHYRYRQTFRGIPIYRRQVIVSERPNGEVNAMFGSIASGLENDLAAVRPQISAQRAFQIAKADWLASYPKSMVVTKQIIERVIYIGDSDLASMAYAVTFSADIPRGGMMTVPEVVVDAISGRILRKSEQLMSATATGSGGNVKTLLHRYDGTERPYLDVMQVGAGCFLENAKVQTVNLANGNPPGPGSYPFQCPDNTPLLPVNDGFAPSNDAHYHGGVVQDMYVAYLGEQPLDIRIKIGVHYGVGTDNAFWNLMNQMLLLGDGSSKFYPLTSLDLVSHEISHGFTLRYSALDEDAQAGALREAFSDMAGEAAEFYLNGVNDFVFAADITKNEDAERYMQYPALDMDGSIDHASNYTPTLNIYQAAGVYNRAFYLLATTTGWDAGKAFKAFATANKRYWTNHPTYNLAACGVELAAVDLGYNAGDVTAAFSAVGVSCGMQWHRPSALALYSGPAPIFSYFNKIISTGDEPTNGEYGLASRATIYRNSGKRYVEFTFSRQTAADEYPYSGTVCVSLRAQNVAVEGNCGMLGDWSIDWHATVETSPVAEGPPTFRSDATILWPLFGSGPLNSWRVAEGDTIGMAVDLDAGKIWYSLNGVWVGDPAAGTAPPFDQSLYDSDKHISGKSVTPHLYADFQNVTVTMRGTASEVFVYSAPSGFTGWSD